MRKRKTFVIDATIVLWVGSLIYASLVTDLTWFQRVVIVGLIVANIMLYELIGFVGKLKISFVPQKKEDE